MKKVSIFYFIIPLFLGIIAYLASNNIIVGGIVLLLGIIYFFLLFMKSFDTYKTSVKRFKACYQFINTFIITLSIKLTIPASLESTALSMDDEFKEEYEGIAHLTDKEKLDYLKGYFQFHIYELFLNVINLYEERGGNILDMSSYLLQESRNQNEYLIRCESMAIRKWVEFAVLWFLSLAIMVLLRFALSQMFDKIAKQLMYQGTIVGIFTFALVSVEILAKKSFKLDLKGWNKK